MMSSRQSPLPPPQSPLVVLGQEKLKTQLDLEEKLRVTGEELLEVYKTSRQWKQVSQLAQTLSSNSERITCIQDCVSSAFGLFELPPSSTTPPVEPPLLEQTDIDAVKTMVEDPHDDFISVIPLTEGLPHEEDSPCWEIKSSQYTKGTAVVRTQRDVTLLLQHICNTRLTPGLLSDKGGVQSADGLREILQNSLAVDNGDQSLLYCFLSSKVNNFSSVALDVECKYY